MRTLIRIDVYIGNLPLYMAPFRDGGSKHLCSLLSAVNGHETRDAELWAWPRGEREYALSVNVPNYPVIHVRVDQQHKHVSDEDMLAEIQEGMPKLAKIGFHLQVNDGPRLYARPVEQPIEA